MLGQVVNSGIENLFIPLDSILILERLTAPLEESQGINEFAPGNVAHEELVAHFMRD